MPPKNTTIMVVEDEKLLRQAIVKKLKIAGMNPISCTTATQALDYLENIDPLPNVIWLDYYLDGMDGLGFMNKLKENKNWKKIPVVVVSNSASPKKVHNMLALGVKKYLLKAQYRLDEIIKIIHDIE